MKTKTADLTGPALDWAVAKAEGLSWWTCANAKWDSNDGYTELILDRDGVLKRFMFDGSRSRAGHWETNYKFKPSTDWSQGGPIIEREEINLEVHECGHTRASFYRMRLTFDGRAKHYHHQHGPTPLIAAMRCFVTSKLGDEVDVPEELL